MSVTAPAGFRAAGVAAGLKPSGGRDVAVVINDGPSRAAAGVFTANRVKAAPVLWTQQVIHGGLVRAVLLNSGGANACTGPQGFTDTHSSAEHLADRLADSPGEIAVCSTGLIGERLPMDLLLAGADAAVAEASRTGGLAAADRVPVRPLKRDLGHGVRCPDRVRGREATGAGRVGQGGVGPREQQVHGQALADQAGRADGDLARGVVQPLRQAFGAGVGVGEAKWPGTGVRAAGVEQDRPHPAAANDLLGPQHGRGLHPVGGEHARRGARRPIVDNNGDVAAARRLEPGSDPRSPEPQRCGNAHVMASRAAGVTGRVLVR